MELNSLGSIDIKWGGGRGGEEGSEKQKINEENLNQLEQILHLIHFCGGKYFIFFSVTN